MRMQSLSLCSNGDKCMRMILVRKLTHACTSIVGMFVKWELLNL